MNIQRIVSIGPVQPSEKPRKMVIGFDVILGVIEMCLANESRSGFVGSREVCNMFTGFHERRGATPTCAQNKDVHEHLPSQAARWTADTALRIPESADLPRARTAPGRSFASQRHPCGCSTTMRHGI